MKPLSILSGALARALHKVTAARNRVGSLTLYTSPSDPDIFDRIREAQEHLARAEGLLEALRDDLDGWSREESHAPEES